MWAAVSSAFGWLGKELALVWAAVLSAFIWLAILLLIFIWVPLLWTVKLFDRDPNRYRTGRWFRRLGVAQTKVNPNWRIKITGREHAKNPRNPYVVVSNHQSMADIPIISLLPWEMKWIGKKSLFDIPYCGRLFKWAGDIPVDRDDEESRSKALEKAIDYLNRGVSVMFFAEGTRTLDGRVKRFKDGAFLAAVRTQLPLLPLVVEGSYDCLPKHSWIFRRCPVVRLRVMPLVETAGLTLADVPMLRDKIRNQAIEQIAAWRKVDPATVDALVDLGPETAAETADNEADEFAH
jgi:1-acyl-sn-glycerol-3-phosphate acyltransferase